MKKLLKTLPFIIIVAGILFAFFYNSSQSNKYLENEKTTSNIKDNRTYEVFKGINWITDTKKTPTSDSLFYQNQPNPIFRKEFQITTEIENVTLNITAAGYYKISINGSQLQENVLDPAWTDFGKRIYFSEYNVTNLVKNNTNCLGVSLGNGFYNPLPMKMWGKRNLREHLTVGKPQFIAKLVINYKNGKTHEVVTDESWKHSYGPIQKNSVYIGVTYDATKEIKGWDLPQFEDAAWKKSVLTSGPGGKLQKTFFPPVAITKHITPVAVHVLGKDSYLVDMGVNFTGTYKIKLSGKKGDTIRFRFGERIYENGTLNPMTTVIGQIKKSGMGGSGAPDIAWQIDSYVIGGSQNEWFQPQFTFHTYRYIEILGLDKKPKTEDIVGLSIHTNVERTNSFSSSSKLLNSIQKMTQRTFLANLVSVQSDCPAREKFGYGGDLNAISESYLSNFNMQSFYRKTLYDWVDAINDSTFVDTAPGVGLKYCGISWESAFLTTQYNLYLYYNDTDIIKELYKLDKAWMEKASRIHPDGMVQTGLSDHESLKPVPVQLTGTAHYLKCAEIMETFASIMEDTEGEKKYKALGIKLRKLIKNKFWDTPVTEKINRQTLFSTLLYHNIIPKKELESAKDSLQKAIENGPNGHFNTGIFGTKYALETLSKHISPSKVYDIVNSTKYPGWGFMIDNGATTIWETWQESDNLYSNCHPMFGSVSEWFYRWLGGIRPDPENPGFKKFILSPHMPEGLESINTTYESPYGTIVSNWIKDSLGTRTYKMEIPKNSTAKVYIPIDNFSKIEIIKNGTAFKIENVRNENFELKEGIYMITVGVQ